MNRSALKKYAPQARLDFIEAVTLRARRLGLDPTSPVSVEQTGDVLLIGGQPFQASVAKQRAELGRRIQQQGFAAVVEALAYTWFNRLVAIRFMELKGYLSHGYRVLSHPQGQQPEILDHVQHLDLPGLDKAEVIRLKTAGNQDEALYREILLAQCHELHRNMPFLFEALDDATELLLPDNLLRTDSLIARLVGDIEECDWQEVEVIGWLYQFYISDKKDEVIGKVVKSEDIPAATQLFTPNWIVQYLVQNSLGRLWVTANPGSNLKEKMPYYIEPAEQTPEVQAQLDALIRINPESLTVLDPACGSGHILVEAYNLLRAIYEERGYRLREIPRLILQKNLYGLDIDDRAAQLAGFALLMKARGDDRRLFDDENNPPNLNVTAIQDSGDLPDEEIAETIMGAAIRIDGGEVFHSDQLFGDNQLGAQHSSGLTARDLRQLIQLFAHGKTFGSLISVPEVLKTKFGSIVNLLINVRSHGDDLSRSYANQVLEQYARPASLLALKYDAVVANPPYMGAKFFEEPLKKFLLKYYPTSSSDIYPAFVERGLELSRKTSFVAIVALQNWLFSSGMSGLRGKLINGSCLEQLVQIGFNSFPSLNSKFAIAAAFIISPSFREDWVSRFVNLNDASESADKEEIFFARKSSGAYSDISQSEFKNMPDCVIAYELSPRLRGLLMSFDRLGEVSKPRRGLATGDNPSFIRAWYEVAASKICFGIESRAAAIESGKKWFPYNMGGDLRKWYGNNRFIVNWENDGFEIRNLRAEGGRLKSRPQNMEYYFLPSLTWKEIGIDFCARVCAQGAISDQTSDFLVTDKDFQFPLLGFINSSLSSYLMSALNPTLHFNVGTLSMLPISRALNDFELSKYVRAVVEHAKEDWDEGEISSDYQAPPLVVYGRDSSRLGEVWLNYQKYSISRIGKIKDGEEAINKRVCALYDVEGEVSCEANGKSTGIYVAEKIDHAIQLLSYSIGCMMGRYSLDETGLIYAQGGGVGFDPSLYDKFPADVDGIVPVTDEPWFEDDTVERVREFVKVVWGAETLVENMEWLADSLGRKAGESADEAIRRYLSTSFYKDHLQTYKKRPIYWLFSSGKQKAFECLVYLHRYNEGTLSRMRMEYVVPLQSRMQARIDKLTDDIDSATSSAQQKALQKRKDKLTKQLEELRRFDENLRPYADQRITLDLDDGVKVNYGKFGNLLAEVKTITGGKED